MNVVDVVELIDDIVVVISALITLASSFVGHSIDLSTKTLRLVTVMRVEVDK